MSMAGYTKLFNSILASTIWRSDDKTRIVWITLLAMADRHGVAEGSLPGLADFARVSIADCQKALLNLESPDEFSRSQEYDGRRIQSVDGGWQILNHAKYRAKLNEDERREYLRLKQAEYRKCRKASTRVNNVSDKSTVLTQAEAEAEAKKKKRATHVERPKKPADSRVADFLKWFPEEFKARRNGAEYLVKHAKHGALVKAMLGATDLERLKKYAAIMLKTNDEFIAETDRGIEILSAKFSWLSDKLAAWEAKQKGQGS